jgi:hypothetical protein
MLTDGTFPSIDITSDFSLLVFNPEPLNVEPLNLTTDT